MAFKKCVSVFFVQLTLVLCALDLASAHYPKPPPKGLRLGFYDNKCEGVEELVGKTTAKYIFKDPTLAASLLRVHFHDCFVRGCDGSVLIATTKSNQAEISSIPNLTLRGFQVVDAVKSAVEKKCPGVVSCADILALVARDAVSMIHGPFWEVPTGRRDGRVSISFEALTNLPPPFGNITVQKAKFAAKGLTVKDLAVLSGGHTIGVSHCTSFSNRLYNFTGVGDTDPSLDPNYVIQLKKKCKPTDRTTIVPMDGSVRNFDEDYYTTVLRKRGLFESDGALLNDEQTKAYVIRQAKTFGSTFNKDFAISMMKMGKIGVLTGNAGEIRQKCSVINKF